MLSLDKEVLTLKTESEKPVLLFAMPIPTLIILTVFTGGLFVTYWLYMNWHTYAQARNKKIFPLGRALLAPLYWFPLCRVIAAELNAANKDYLLGANICALLMSIFTIFVITIGFSERAEEDFSLLCTYYFFYLGLLAWIQAAINHLCRD